MNVIGIILIAAGVITAMFGGAKFVIAAFEEGVWWGLGVLFIPIVPPIFLVVRFGDAWRPALTFVVGFVLVLLGVFVRTAAGA